MSLNPFDPALFKPEAVSAETRAFNETLAAQMKGQPKPWERPPAPDGKPAERMFASPRLAGFAARPDADRGGQGPRAGRAACRGAGQSQGRLCPPAWRRADHGIGRRPGPDAGADHERDGARLRQRRVPAGAGASLSGRLGRLRDRRPVARQACQGRVRLGLAVDRRRSPPAPRWPCRRWCGCATSTASPGFKAANLSYGNYDTDHDAEPEMDRRGKLLPADQGHPVLHRALRAQSRVRRDPDMSALYANLKTLPPALFTVGTLDAFLDDSLFVYARWIAAGNAAELAVYPGGIHGFNMFPYAIAGEANAPHRCVPEARADKGGVMPRTVRASINYLAAMAERPRYHAQDHTRDNLVLDPRAVDIEDLRGTGTSLAVEGFALVPHRSAVADFRDEAEVARVHGAEIEDLLRRETGADHVRRHRQRHPALRRAFAAIGQAVSIPSRRASSISTSAIRRRANSPNGPGRRGKSVRRFAHYNVWRAITTPPQGRAAGAVRCTEPGTGGSRHGRCGVRRAGRGAGMVVRGPPGATRSAPPLVLFLRDDARRGADLQDQ